MACEGTRFTEAKRIESMKVAREKHLPELHYHLLRRTKGFTLIMQGAQGKSNHLLHSSPSSGRPPSSRCLQLHPGLYQRGCTPTFRTLLKGQSCRAQLHIK